MVNSTFQVILSTDGKHTVIATSNDPVQAKAALEWARVTYDAVVKRYGLKHEQYQKDGDENGKDAVPTCAFHELPMIRVEGKYGPFWSCHQRNEDGSFCSYRPNEH